MDLSLRKGKSQLWKCKNNFEGLAIIDLHHRGSLVSVLIPGLSPQLKSQLVRSILKVNIMKNICFSSKNICTHPLCLGHLRRVGGIHGGQRRRQLEYFPQHEVGAQVEVHARAQNLANNNLMRIQLAFFPPCRTSRTAASCTRSPGGAPPARTWPSPPAGRPPPHHAGCRGS